MTGAELARAIANLCSAKPDLDAKLATNLAKWLKGLLGKMTTLDDFRRAASTGAGDLVAIYLSTLSSADLARLTKKLDPHRPDLQKATPDRQHSHLLALIGRECDPADKPSPRVTPIDAVLAIADPILRRSELAKHTPAQLKKAIKDNQIDGATLNSRATKTELIEHIQAALAAGWPRAQSLLTDSKY
jgi:hypothetical protein